MTDEEIIKALMCHIEAFDLREVLSNLEAKKKKGGYI